MKTRKLNKAELKDNKQFIETLDRYSASYIPSKKTGKPTNYNSGWNDCIEEFEEKRNYAINYIIKKLKGYKV